MALEAERDLIVRLGTAIEGSRELDALVAREIGYARFGDLTEAQAIEAIRDADDENIKTMPRVTTCLDAALTLVPAGLPCSINRDRLGWGWAEVTTDLHSGKSILRFEDGVCARTPALAVCIAALKARDVESRRDD